MIGPPNVRIALTSRPENVALIREALSGLADALDLDDSIDDVKAAVSEAANNVVMHAYGDGEGPLEVEVLLVGRQLIAVVRDVGVGIGPRAVDESFAGRGIGLSVIEALAARMELRARQGPGVEVVMHFDIPPQPALPGAGAQTALAARRELDEDGWIELTIAPPALGAAIFNRVVTAVAARAGFSIDRLSDAQLIADAIGAHANEALEGSEVVLAMAGADHCLQLRIGPLRPGGAQRVVEDSAIGELGSVIERLVDGHEARVVDGSRELLSLTMREQRRSG